MKFRIKKEDELYCAEYKKYFCWWYVSGSWSRSIETTKETCRKFVKQQKEHRTKVIETFIL